MNEKEIKKVVELTKLKLSEKQIQQVFKLFNNNTLPVSKYNSRPRKKYVKRKRYNDSNVTKRIYDFLKEKKNFWHTARSICEELNLNNNSVTSILYKFARLGVAYRRKGANGIGVYQYIFNPHAKIDAYGNPLHKKNSADDKKSDSSESSAYKSTVIFEDWKK